VKDHILPLRDRTFELHPFSGILPCHALEVLYERLEPLAPQANPVALPVHNLDPIAAPITKHK